jgi:hydrogenase-4 component B
VACFVKVFGAVFLGTARSEHAQHAHESPMTMIAPMAVLVVCCTLIGLAPLVVVPMMSAAVAAWMPQLTADELILTARAPLDWISVMGVSLVGLMLVGGSALRLQLRGTVATGPTWGCGYVAPTARMQYTSSSFAQMLVSLFGWALRPRTHKAGSLPLFPHNTTFHSEVPDTVLDGAILPAFRFGGWLSSKFRVFQQGSIQTYLLYIFVALIVLLLWR